jgi:hypothetical protein
MPEDIRLRGRSESGQLAQESIDMVLLDNVRQHIHAVLPFARRADDTVRLYRLHNPPLQAQGSASLTP